MTGRELPQDGSLEGMRGVLRLSNLLPFRQVLGIKVVESLGVVYETLRFCR